MKRFRAVCRRVHACVSDTPACLEVLNAVLSHAGQELRR